MNTKEVPLDAAPEQQQTGEPVAWFWATYVHKSAPGYTPNDVRVVRVEDYDSLLTALREAKRETEELRDKAQDAFVHVWNQWRRAQEAITALYFAGYWHCDRPVDELMLWTAARDAAEIAPGQTQTKLGKDRSESSLRAAQQQRDEILEEAAKAVEGRRTHHPHRDNARKDAALTVAAQAIRSLKSAQQK